MFDKWSDSAIGVQVYELNLEFLELVQQTATTALSDSTFSTSAGAGGRQGFGLDAPLRQRLATLEAGQLDTIAHTPCLLAGFAVMPPRDIALGIAERRVGTFPMAGPQLDAARLFAASLLGWLWHTARRDVLLASLCIGPDPQSVEELRKTGFRDLRRTTALASDFLEARFCRHPRLWPDLLHAACGDNPDVLAATRLSAVQLALIGRSTQTPSVARGARRSPRSA